MPESTITFIIPIQDMEDLIVEQVNAIFAFSEHYGGFCELLIVTDEIEDARIKLASLAIKLNRIGHPHVRTRMIRYTSKLSVQSLMETSINHALGQRIVIMTTQPETIRNLEINDIMQREILLAEYMLDASALEENLRKAT